MKFLKTATLFISAALVAVCGALAITNPEQEDYEDYAVVELTNYLRTEGDDLCGQIPDFLQELVGNGCSALVGNILDNNQNQIRRLITDQTERENYYIFSIYTTNLEIHESLPTYHIETVGIFQQFYTYRAEER